MKKFKTSLILIILTAVLSGQVVWNEPPDTVWYENGQRWVEVILPTPQNLKAETISYTQVKLTWEVYWTQELISAYTTKFGYAPKPNRYSFYRNGQALTGVPYTENEYIDVTTIIGHTYIYKYMASDLNYQTVDGLQHWSQRSLPTTITVGENQSSLSYPSNFAGYYEPDSAMIILSWDYVKDASSYIIYKSYVNPGDSTWVYLSIPVGNTNKYFDSDLSLCVGYVYDIIAVNGNIKSIRATNRLTINSGTLSIEEEEYWEAVDEYEKDRKISWFGCSLNK